MTSGNAGFFHGRWGKWIALSRTSCRWGKWIAPSGVHFLPQHEERANDGSFFHSSDSRSGRHPRSGILPEVLKPWVSR